LTSLLLLDALYLLKAVQALGRQGVEVYAICIQNEPQYSNPTYPSSTLTPDVEARIGRQLKSLLQLNRLSSVKLIGITAYEFYFPEFPLIYAGYDHNWDGATDYAVKLMQAAPDTFDGVAFHCYGGQVGQQGTFSSLYPNKVGACVITIFAEL
jgi:O-glycosyl hydrolase